MSLNGIEDDVKMSVCWSCRVHNDNRWKVFQGFGPARR